MSRYAQVDRSVWVDEKFAGLSGPKPNAQSLFLWLLTSPDASFIPGTFRVGLAGISEAIGWPLASTRKFFAELEAAGMVRADLKARLVWLPNALKRNEPRSADNLRPWAKAWTELPECALKAEIWESMYAYFQGRGGEFPERFETLCPHPYVDPKPHPKGGPMGGDSESETGTHSPALNNKILNPDPNPDPEQKVVSAAATAADGCRLETNSKPPVRTTDNPDAVKILERLRSHPELELVATVGHAERLAGLLIGGGKRLDWLLVAVDELADKAAAAVEAKAPWNAEFMGGKVMAFGRNAKAPKPKAGENLTLDQAAAVQRRNGVQQGSAGPGLDLMAGPDPEVTNGPL